MSFADELGGVHGAILEAFAEECLVTIYPADDPWMPIRIRGVYDDEATFLIVGEDITYSSSNPLLGIRDSDHEPKRGDVVEVKGKRFRTVDVRPDGRGWSVLVLETVL